MTIAPDASVAGLLGHDADALRYGEGSCDEAYEAPGILRALMPTHARVLDVGCGGGGYTLDMNRGKDNEVVCIEPDPDRAASARAKGLTVHEGLLDEAFLAAHGKFDVVVFGDVLEHMVDPAPPLRAARQALAEGGRILISVPNVAHWTVRLKLLLGKFNYQPSGIMDATHLRWFTRKTLLDVLHNVDLEVVEFHNSAGLWLGEYNSKIARLIPFSVRKAAVHALLPAFPNLMGVQHVLSARPVAALR